MEAPGLLPRLFSPNSGPGWASNVDVIFKSIFPKNNTQYYNNSNHLIKKSQMIFYYNNTGLHITIIRINDDDDEWIDYRHNYILYYLFLYSYTGSDFHNCNSLDNKNGSNMFRALSWNTHVSVAHEWLRHDYIKLHLGTMRLRKLRVEWSATNLNK